MLIPVLLYCSGPSLKCLKESRDHDYHGGNFKLSLQSTSGKRNSLQTATECYRVLRSTIQPADAMKTRSAGMRKLSMKTRSAQASS